MSSNRNKIEKRKREAKIKKAEIEKVRTPHRGETFSDSTEYSRSAKSDLEEVFLRNESKGRKARRRKHRG